MKHAAHSSFKPISWRAPEYLFRRKTLLWYTHVSVFFFIVLVLLFWVQNWFGIVILALLFWIFMSKSEEKPKNVTYTVDHHGITIGERTLTFSEVESFTAEVAHRTPVITLKLTYSFSLPITLIVKHDVKDDVIEHLSQYVPLSNEFSFMRWLSHRLHY